MKGKIVNKSNTVILVSFLVSAYLMWLIYKNLGIYPNGSKTVLLMDMKGQYSEFLFYLRHIFNKDNSFFFSWSRSMGGNFIGLFSYYIASPLSWLTLFFSLKEMPLAIFWLTVLKVGLCGMSFAIYAEYAFNERKGNPVVIIFSICYALMSYNMVYSLCLMWLDGVILMPLVLLGIEQILKGKKGLVYLLSIAALFMINYYTAYMIGIFSGIYIIYRAVSLLEKNKIKDTVFALFRFAGNTILALGLAAPLLIPTLNDLASGKLAQEGWNPNLKYSFTFVNIFTKFKPGFYDGITNSGPANTGLPAIFCGVLVLVLAVVFLMQKRVNWREKLGAIAIFIFMLCSFWIGKLNLAWHGFQYPNWFPFRYAFLLSFFMIYMAYRACLNLKVNNTWKIPLLILTFTFVARDMYQNGTAMIKGLDGEFWYSQKEEYDTFYDKTMPLVQDIQNRDTSFYRMDKNYEYSKNDAMLLGYNGMTHYSSTYNASINNFTRKLGIAQTHLWNSNYGSTPITDSIFNVKYLLYDKSLPNAYTAVVQNQGVTAYENKYVLPIAFAANIPEQPLKLEDGDPFANQNKLLTSLAGTKEDYFTAVNFQKSTMQGGWKYTFTADSNNPIYLYMRANQYSSVDLYVNGKKLGVCLTSESYCNQYLGQFDKGTSVTVECKSSTSNIEVYSEYLYELQMDSYIKTMQRLNVGGLEITSHKNAIIKGKIVVGVGKKIFTSIPYDKGLIAKVDGKRVKTEKFEDTFLVIPAEQGEHTIVIKYSCPGFGLGMLFALLAIIASILYFKTDKCRKLFDKGKIAWLNRRNRGEKHAEN